MLYDSRVIIDYLDERFPHPPLMPVDPILRAQFRLAMYRIERDWYGLANRSSARTTTRNMPAEIQNFARRMLESAELFKVKPYFLSDEFSLVDASIGPILWRLRRYEIDLPPQAQAMASYASSLFGASLVARQPFGCRDRNEGRR